MKKLFKSNCKPQNNMDSRMRVRENLMTTEDKQDQETTIII